MPPATQRAWLIHGFAFAQRLAVFEQALRLIFGTQISALRHLSASTVPLTRAALQNIYESHVEKVTAAGLTPVDFDSWVGFLLQRMLIFATPNGDYQATEVGRQFLHYADNLPINEATKLW